MTAANLKTCPYFGPYDDGQRAAAFRISNDQLARPLNYLPPPINLSDAELELAENYANGDLTGGYIASQIAHFRRGPTDEQHQSRRKTFSQLCAEINGFGYRLPEPFVELVENDDFVTRMRHNTIWLRLPDEVAGLPSNPDNKLFLMFYEGQGCDYWHLLLSTDGSHIVTFSEYPYGLKGVLPAKHEPEDSEMEVYQCAKSFSEWITVYFDKCKEADDKYENLLQMFGGNA